MKNRSFENVCEEQKVFVLKEKSSTFTIQIPKNNYLSILYNDAIMGIMQNFCTHINDPNSIKHTQENHEKLFLDENI